VTQNTKHTFSKSLLQLICLMNLSLCNKINFPAMPFLALIMTLSLMLWRELKFLEFHREELKKNIENHCLNQ